MAVPTQSEVQAAIDKLKRVGSNRVSDDEIQDATQKIFDFLKQSDTTSIPIWASTLTFNTDGTGDGEFCRHEDTAANVRIWQTKIDANTGNEPPTDPAVTEDLNWKEISASTGSSLKGWEPGLYGEGLIIVFHNDKLYKLNVATRPYESTNIDTEIEAGDWVMEGPAQVSSAEKTARTETAVRKFSPKDVADMVDAITGLLANLTTTEKSTLVAAINELKSSKEDVANKGVANGYASLNESAKVPAAQLPSYVDDIVEADTKANFPTTGEDSKVYVALDTNKTYRWSGTAYVEVSPSDVNSVNGYTGIITLTTSDIGEETNLYFTDARAVAAILANDGAGSGLEADLLGSGQVTDLSADWLTTISSRLKFHAYDNAALNKPSSVNNANWLINIHSMVSNYGHQLAGDDAGNIYLRKVSNGAFGAWNKIWHAGNDSNLAKKDTANEFTQTQTVNGSTDNREYRVIRDLGASGIHKVRMGISDVPYVIGEVDGVIKSRLNFKTDGTLTDVNNKKLVTQTNNIKTKTASFSLSDADSGAILECSGTITVTIPAGLALDFNCTIVNIGTGTITIAAASGVSLLSEGTTLAEKKGANLYNNAVDSFRAFGGLI